MVFDRTNRSMLARWWWTVDRGTFICLILLVCIGGMMAMAASPQVARRIGLGDNYFIKRQILYLGAGLATAWGLSFLNVIATRRIAVIGFFIAIVLLLFTPFLGMEAKGAKRWIYLFGVSIQPSEFIKPFFAVLTAWLFARRHMQPGFPGFLIGAGCYALVVLLLLAQPDLGMTFIISLVWITQIFVAGLSLGWIAALVLIGLGGMYLAYLIFPHVSRRFDMFLNPDQSENFQVEKSLEAFRGGGIFGMGPGEGKIKTVLPDSHTDFVFSVLGEEFGAFACALVMLLFAVVVLRGLHSARRESDLFTAIAVTGLVTQIGAQAMVNIGVSLHLLPTKGMTLPFLSYGGSSTIALAIGMGMLLALTRKRFG